MSACLLATGCEAVGPAVLRSGRPSYNTAIQRTDIAQILLNIVRLRFADRPYFLEVTSISSNAELAGSFGGSEEAGVGGALSYSERPNIIYSPLTGDDFVRQLLTPIDIDTFSLLMNSGWEFDDIMRIFINRINGIPNAVTATGPTPERVPEYGAFLKLAGLLDELDDSGSVSVAEAEEHEEEGVLYIAPEARNDPALAELQRLLGLDPALSAYRVRFGLWADRSDEIVIETRPILAAMFYLGQGIRLPESVVEEGRAAVVRDPSGEPFDWAPVFADLFEVHSASWPPGSESYMTVKYGGDYYYIRQDDIQSKEVLTMLSMVFTLQAGSVPADRPVLTLPVGR